jgi:hypothetical protein
VVDDAHCWILVLGGEVGWVSREVGYIGVSQWQIGFGDCHGYRIRIHLHGIYHLLHLSENRNTYELYLVCFRVSLSVPSPTY